MLELVISAIISAAVYFTLMTSISILIDASSTTAQQAFLLNALILQNFLITEVEHSGIGIEPLTSSFGCIYTTKTKTFDGYRRDMHPLAPVSLYRGHRYPGQMLGDFRMFLVYSDYYPIFPESYTPTFQPYYPPTGCGGGYMQDHGGGDGDFYLEHPSKVWNDQSTHIGNYEFDVGIYFKHLSPDRFCPGIRIIQSTPWHKNPQYYHSVLPLNTSNLVYTMQGSDYKVENDRMVNYMITDFLSGVGRIPSFKWMSSADEDMLDKTPITNMSANKWMKWGGGLPFGGDHVVITGTSRFHRVIYHFYSHHGYLLRSDLGDRPRIDHKVSDIIDDIDADYVLRPRSTGALAAVWRDSLLINEFIAGGLKSSWIYSNYTLLGIRLAFLIRGTEISATPYPFRIFRWSGGTMTPLNKKKYTGSVHNIRDYTDYIPFEMHIPIRSLTL